MLKLRAFNSITKKWRWVNEDAIGESFPVKIVRVPITFETSELVSDQGISVYSALPGDSIVWGISYFSIPEISWNGSTPRMNFVNRDEINPLGGTFHTWGIDATDAEVSGTNTFLTDPLALFVTGSLKPIQVFPEGGDLGVAVDDGAGGDPGSTQGVGVLVLFVIPVNV